MFKETKTLCYVLVFDQIDIIQKTLESLTRYANRLDIVIIENPSKNTPKIRKLIDEHRRFGHIKRHYLFERNITSRAYDIILDHERTIIERYRYTVVTDGDVASNDNWLEEERRALMLNPSLFCIGITFDMSNLPIDTFPDATGWVPADISRGGIGYKEALTGMHFVMFRSHELIKFLQYKTEEHINFVDGNIKQYVYEVLHKKWGRTNRARGVHLTWDLYRDLNHPYTKLKLNKSFQETWYHSESSPFALEEF